MPAASRFRFKPGANSGAPSRSGLPDLRRSLNLAFVESMCPSDFSKQLRTRLAQGLPLDDALQELRAAGASIIECIVATRHVRGCDLAEAKRLIHESKVWADITEATNTMWDQLANGSDDDSESAAAPNNRPPSQVTSPPEIPSSESLRTPSSGRCGRSGFVRYASRF